MHKTLGDISPHPLHPLLPFPTFQQAPRMLKNYKKPKIKVSICSDEGIKIQETA